MKHPIVKGHDLAGHEFDELSAVLRLPIFRLLWREEPAGMVWIDETLLVTAGNHFNAPICLRRRVERCPDRDERVTV